MKARIVATCVLSLGLLLALAGLARSTQPEARFSTEVSLEPAKGDSFLLRAKVTDLASGEVLAGPSLRIAGGQPAEAETTLEGRGLAIHLRANVEAGGTAATYSVDVTKEKNVLAQHSAKISLR